MGSVLEELSSESDTSDGESDGEERKEETVDEDDEAERAKLPQYASRFKVSVLGSWEQMFTMEALSGHAFMTFI